MIGKSRNKYEGHRLFIFSQDPVQSTWTGYHVDMEDEGIITKFAVADLFPEMWSSTNFFLDHPMRRY